jgi:hypothetical protein
MLGPGLFGLLQYYFALFWDAKAGIYILVNCQLLLVLQQSFFTLR